LTDQHSIWHDDAYWFSEPDQQLKFQTFKNRRWRTATHLEKLKNVVLMDIINSLLKTGNKTANMNVKKLQFIHTVNGDGSKTAKIFKKAMLTILTLTFRLC